MQVAAILLQSTLFSSRRQPAAGILLSTLLATSLLAVCADRAAHARTGNYEISVSRVYGSGELDAANVRLSSAAALVADERGRRVYAKGSEVVKPIASITNSSVGNRHRRYRTGDPGAGRD